MFPLYGFCGRRLFLLKRNIDKLNTLVKIWKKIDRTFFLYRFVIGNIRNQLDYSPQAIYWLGCELSQNKEFEWVDGTEMLYKVCIMYQICGLNKR